MKRLLLLFLSLQTIHVFAQGSLPEDAKACKQLFIGFNFSPDYSYRTLSNEVMEDMYVPKFGLTSGFNVGFQLNNRTSFETGIHYSNKGFQTKTMEYRYIDSDPFAPVSSKHKFNIHFIDIPFRANFVYGQNKARFIFGTGLIANIFLKEVHQYQREYSDGRIEDGKRTLSEDDYNIVTLSPFISAGLQYQFNPDFQLRIEPVFRHQVISFIKDRNGVYLWNAGLNFGVYYNL